MSTATYGTVPYTQPLDCPISFQPRQFEYHNVYDVLAVGTTDGKVALVDWSESKNNRPTLLGLTSFESKGNVAPNTDELSQSILALSWLNNSKRGLLAASSTGSACLYDVDFDGRALNDDTPHSVAWGCFPKKVKPYFKGRRRRLFSSSSQDVVQHYNFNDDDDQEDKQYFKLRYDFGKLTDDLTSIHCNCTDELLAASGYTADVKIYDLHTAKLVRTFDGIHEDHINITRFANNLPQILLTCSFDSTIKLWDNRVSQRKPIISLNSSAGNVMVCFSPNDMYFLVSAVDNQVTQYTTVDGRLHLKYDIPSTQCDSNYTRSYYANGGDIVVSGSSNQDSIHICSSLTGKVVDTVKLYEGRRSPSLYIQSLRANPKIHNRCCVLVFYRSTEFPYEMIDVDMNRDHNGIMIDPPFSLAAIAEYADDLEAQVGKPEHADVEFVTNDHKTLYAHSVILQARWTWYMTNHITNGNNSGDDDDEDGITIGNDIIVPASSNNSGYNSPLCSSPARPPTHPNTPQPKPLRSTASYGSYESLFSLTSASRSNSYNDLRSIPRSPSQLIYHLDWNVAESDDNDNDKADVDEVCEVEAALNKVKLVDLPTVVKENNDDDKKIMNTKQQQDAQFVLATALDDDDILGLDTYVDSDDDDEEEEKTYRWNPVKRRRTEIHFRVEFDDLSYNELYIILHYLYCGRLHKSITLDIAKSLYSKTQPKMYHLPRLGQLIEQYVRQQVTLHECVNIYHFAIKSRARRLAAYCEDYVARQYHYYTERYKDLTKVFGRRGLSRIKKRFDDGCISVVQNNPYLLARSAHDCVVVRKKVYIIGGYHNRGTQTLHQIPVYDILTNTWVILSASGKTPDSLCFHTANYMYSETYGECIVCFGGDASNVTCANVIILELSKMIWHMIDADGVIPSARKRHTCVRVGNELWMYGGRDRTTVKGDVFVFNINTLRWQRPSLEGEVPHPRFGHTMTYVSELESLIITGGFTPMGVIGMDVIAFDLNSRSFSRPPVPSNGGYTPNETPRPRCRHSCELVRHNNRAYLFIFGGSTSLNFVNDENEAHLQDSWLLNTQTWAWEHIHDNSGVIPSRRSTHSCWVWTDDMNNVQHPVVWGGADSQAFPRDMMTLDVETRTWAPIAMFIAGTQREPQIPIAYPLLVSQAKTMLITDVLSDPCIITPKSSMNDMNMSTTMVQSHSSAETVVAKPPIPSSMTRVFVDGYCVIVSKIMLASRSCNFFKVMFSSSFAEDEHNEVHMEAMSLKTFLFIVYFLYCGDIDYQMLDNFKTDKASAFGFGLKRSKSVPSHVHLRAIARSPDRKTLARSITMTKMNVCEGKSVDDNEQVMLQSLEEITVTPTELATRSIQSILKEAYIKRNNKAYDGKFITCDPVDILVAAKRLGLQSLCNVIEVALAKQITHNNVYPLLQFAAYHRMDTLMNTCIMYALVNHFALLNHPTPLYEQLSSKVKTLLMTHYRRLFQFRVGFDDHAPLTATHGENSG